MAQRIPGAAAFALPRRATSFSATVTAIQELAELGNQWYQSGLRTKKEQEEMLQGLRRLLQQIDAGYTENMGERFQREADQVSRFGKSQDEAGENETR